MQCARFGKLITAVTVGCLFLSSQTISSYSADTRDPRVVDHVISGNGDLIPASPVAGSLAAPAAVAAANSPLITIPNRKPLSVSEVTTTLNTLFEWGPASSRYATNFLMLPGTLDIKNDNKATVLGSTPDTQILYRPYSVSDQRISIKISRPGALVALPAFSVDPGNAIFVRLEGFGNLVPIPVAEVVEASFVNGLVTRLLLGEYQRMWKKNLNLSFATNSAFNAIIGDAFVQPANYSAPNPAEFSAAVKSILANNPVQPVSLLYGWKAGDDLDALVGTDVKYREAVWKLLGSRFSIQDMGRMVAFTLTYLSGYSKNQRIVAIINGGTADAVKDPTKILDNLASDPNITTAKNMMSGFIQNIIAEMYVISRNTTMEAGERDKLVGLYYGFIKGLTSGASDAADQVYLDVFKLAYGLGYQTGFRDGYAEGYAAGYKDGYAVGYKNAWAEANKTITALQGQVSDLQNQLSQARQPGGGGDFWDTVSHIGSAIGTAVGTIGGIIGLF